MVIQCFGCFQRIDEYCKISQVSVNKSPEATADSELLNSLDTDQLELVSCPEEPSHLITFTNASISWTKGSKTVLNSINVVLGHVGVTMIVGPVASGKSALIESILGETNLVDGDVSPCLSRIAYCSQIPWLQNETIRDNIIGATDFEGDWYKRTLWLCALEEDLMHLPNGDLMEIGTNGITLSGGQKHRIVSSRSTFTQSTCRY